VAARPRVAVAAAARFATGSRDGSFGFQTARTTIKPDAAAAVVVGTVVDVAVDVGTAVVAAAVAAAAGDVVDVAAVADVAAAPWTGSAVAVGSWPP